MVGSASTMLRDARVQAGLSQTELARRAGVAQSVISTYESAKREPGLRMLTKLVNATGYDMAIELVPLSEDGAVLPDTPAGRLLRGRRSAVIATAARRGASNIRVFGSVARGDDGQESDIDLLVDLEDGVGLVALAGLQRELGELLGVPVDVVPAATLKPAMREAILAEAVSL